MRWIWRAVALMGLIPLFANTGTMEALAQGADRVPALRAKVSQRYGQGKYTAAIPIAERYVALTRKKHGERYTKFATAITWLALIYQAQGRYAEAEPLYKRSLAIREKVFGPDRPDVATSPNYVGGLYYAQGR
jgi:tetratricopeptide (TPR) repeat protein